MDQDHDPVETARWAATTTPDELVRELAPRVIDLHFRGRALVLDAALTTHPTLALTLCRALHAALDRDGLRATLESLPLSTLGPALLALAIEDPELFATALAAWPGPLSWISVVRPLASYPGDDRVRAALIAALEGPYRAASRTRAITELVALGAHPESTAAIDRRLDDTVHDLRASAVRALARIAATGPLLRALESPHAVLRAEARLLIVPLVKRREIPREAALAALYRLAESHEDSRERYEARATLRALGERVARVSWSGLHEDAAQSLLHEVRTLANRVAISAYAEVLADADDPRALEAVRDALAHAPKVSRALVAFRPFFKGPAGETALRALANDSDPLVRERAAELSHMKNG